MIGEERKGYRALDPSEFGKPVKTDKPVNPQSPDVAPDGSIVYPESMPTSSPAQTSPPSTISGFGRTALYIALGLVVLALIIQVSTGF